MHVLKSALKAVRASQPFNYITTSICRSIGLRQEFIIKHLPRVGTTRAKLPNGRWLYLRSRGDDWISNQVYWRGWSGYELDVAPLLFRLATKARVTLDIGAHIGFYSLLAAHANPNGQVYAFEPLSTAYERLRRNVALNNLLTNVHCINKAVGETDGNAAFFYGPGIALGSSLSPEILRFCPSLQKTIVQVLTIDRFVRDNRLSQIDLVKIDTETTELQVLRGMVETLRRDRPIIFCEIWGVPGQPFEEILLPLGYHFYDLTVEGPVPHRGSGMPGNYLFTTLSAEEVAQL